MEVTAIRLARRTPWRRHQARQPHGDRGHSWIPGCGSMSRYSQAERGSPEQIAGRLRHEYPDNMRNPLEPSPRPGCLRRANPESGLRADQSTDCIEYDCGTLRPFARNLLIAATKAHGVDPNEALRFELLLRSYHPVIRGSGPRYGHWSIRHETLSRADDNRTAFSASIPGSPLLRYVHMHD